MPLSDCRRTTGPSPPTARISAIRMRSPSPARTISSWRRHRSGRGCSGRSSGTASDPALTTGVFMPIRTDISTDISRRRFLTGVTAVSLCTLGATGVSGGGAATAAPAPDAGTDLTALTAADAVRALANGDIQAENYARALLRRCEAGASLNAFIRLRPELVLEAARECDRRRRSGARLGSLHGLPIAIKDSVNTRDLPTTAGTPALRHFQPREDAPLVRALRKAGAIVLG